MEEELLFVVSALLLAAFAQMWFVISSNNSPLVGIAAMVTTILIWLGVLLVVCLIFGTERVIRWPFLIILSSVTFIQLVLYAILRYSIFLLELFRCSTRHRALRRMVRSGTGATSFEQWQRAAQQLDHATGRDTWKTDDRSKLYNWSLIRSLRDELREARAAVEGLPYVPASSSSSSAAASNSNGSRRRSVSESPLLHAEPIPAFGLPDLTLCDPHTGYKTLRTSSTPPSASNNDAAVSPDVAIAGAEAATGVYAHRWPAGQGRGSSAPLLAATIGNSMSYSNGIDLPKMAGASTASGSSHASMNDAPRIRMRNLQQALRSSVQKNIGGIMNEALYSTSNCGTKKLIEDFVDEVVQSLQVVERDPSGVLSAADKLAFFEQLKSSYGFTALCLSGGGGLAQYHIGVVRALLDEGMMPHILSGASCGSLIAAHVCCRSDEELKLTLNAETFTSKMDFAYGMSVWQKTVNFIKHGNVFDPAKWIDMMRWHCKGDTTFLEAFRATGRILNISATPGHKHSPSMLLNYVTTPHVVIWTAILASTSVPGLLPPAPLYEKTKAGDLRLFQGKRGQGKGWRDGSLKKDLPFEDLAYTFNASYFLVSQCNPHIVPFFFYNRGDAGRRVVGWRRSTGNWRGGYMLSMFESILKHEMKKNLAIMAELGLLPDVLGTDWSYLFLQDFQGHVTLVPELTLNNYIKIVSSPDRADMDRFCHHGQLMVWRKHALLRTRQLVGSTLNRLLALHRPRATSINMTPSSSVQSSPSSSPSLRPSQSWLAPPSF